MLLQQVELGNVGSFEYGYAREKKEEHMHNKQSVIQPGIQMFLL